MFKNIMKKISEMAMKRTAKSIMRDIRNNDRFEKIEYLYEILSAKYGNITVAGGSMIDCYFDKDFYDVDIFISEADLKEEYRQPHRSENNILYVIRDVVDGEAIDIVVLNYSVSEHISRFDQNFKKIYFDGKLNIKKAAVKDIMNNEITLGSMGGAVNYFRLIKSARKYGMAVNQDDLYIAYNFASYLKYDNRLRVADKYAEYLKEFEPMDHDFVDRALAESTYKYVRSYWKVDSSFVGFQSYKKYVLSK